MTSMGFRRGKGHDVFQSFQDSGVDIFFIVGRQYDQSLISLDLAQQIIGFLIGISVMAAFDIGALSK